MYDIANLRLLEAKQAAARIMQKNGCVDTSGQQSSTGANVAAVSQHRRRASIDGKHVAIHPRMLPALPGSRASQRCRHSRDHIQVPEPPRDTKPRWWEHCQEARADTRPSSMLMGSPRRARPPSPPSRALTVALSLSSYPMESLQPMPLIRGKRKTIGLDPRRAADKETTRGYCSRRWLSNSNLLDGAGHDTNPYRKLAMNYDCGSGATVSLSKMALSSDAKSGAKCDSLTQQNTESTADKHQPDADESFTVDRPSYPLGPSANICNFTDIVRKLRQYPNMLAVFEKLDMDEASTSRHQDSVLQQDETPQQTVQTVMSE